MQCQDATIDSRSSSIALRLSIVTMADSRDSDSDSDGLLTVYCYDLKEHFYLFIYLSIYLSICLFISSLISSRFGPEPGIEFA